MNLNETSDTPNVYTNPSMYDYKSLDDCKDNQIN